MAVLLFGGLFGGGCTPDRSFSKRLNAITKPYRFNFINWEFYALKAVLDRKEATDDDVTKVSQYFDAVKRINHLKAEIAAIKAGNRPGELAPLEAELARLQQQAGSLESTVEVTLERQIRDTLAEQGIFNPIDKYLRLRLIFPPPSFLIDDPPHMLVVSPRDRIDIIREIMLRQDLSVEEMESIEARVDKFNVSSLVVELGGLATFPSFVTNKGELRFTLDTAGEEWVHKYLLFKPLGFKYLLEKLGITHDYDIVTINETVASMVGKEIGGIVYQKYYDDSGTEPEPKETGFDFNREMREIRRAVDEYLARGEIEQAEEFMEQKRQYLAANGYYLRKLNQAYFAFHGAYADSPTSISPIGAELKQLRSQSKSLKEFLDTVASVTSRRDLMETASKEATPPG